MIWGLVTLLVGILVLAIIIYILSLAVDLMPGIPPQIKQIALLIIGLIGLLIIIYLALQAFGAVGGGVVMVR